MHNGFLEELESGCPMISNIMPHETEKPMSKPLEPEQKKLASVGNKGFEVVGGNSSPSVVGGEFEKALKGERYRIDEGCPRSEWSTQTTDHYQTTIDLEFAHNTDMQALRDQLKQSANLIEMQSAKLKAMQTQTNDLAQRLKQAHVNLAQRDGLVLPGSAV